MAQMKVLFLTIGLIFAVAIQTAESRDSTTCDVDGKIYQNNERFTSGRRGCAQCICNNGGVSCNIKHCQRKNQPVSNSLRQVKVSENSVNDDIDRIKRVLVKRITDNDFLSTSSPYRFSAFLNKLYEKRFSNIAEKMNKNLIYSTDAYLQNNSTVQQTLKTLERSFEVTESEEVSVTKTSGVSFTAGAEAFGFSMEVSSDESKSDTTTKGKSVTKILTAPSQEVNVPSNSQIKITYNVFEYEATNNYLLDFEVSDYSYVGLLPMFALDYSFKKFMQPYHDVLPIGDDDHLTLEYEHDKFLLKNFPTQQKLINHDVNVFVGREETLN